MARRLAIALLVTAAACSSGGGRSTAAKKRASTTTTTPADTGVRMAVTSPAFKDGGAIPVQFTCDGTGQSPPLAWTGAPAGTASFALRMQDADTPQKFIHWIVYDIPPTTTSLAAGRVPPDAKQTANSFGKQGYASPCPPAGQRHRYVLTLLALSTQLSASETVSPADLWATLERSAVAGKGELTGTYQRAS